LLRFPHRRNLSRIGFRRDVHRRFRIRHSGIFRFIHRNVFVTEKKYERERESFAPWIAWTPIISNLVRESGNCRFWVPMTLLFQITDSRRSWIEANIEEFEERERELIQHFIGGRRMHGVTVSNFSHKVMSNYIIISKFFYILFIKVIISLFVIT